MLTPTLLTKAVGIVDKKKIFNKNDVKPGDIVIALPSSGVHSNGFSLVRKVFGEEKLSGDLGAALLTPTKIYVKDILSLMDPCRAPGRFLEGRRKAPG